MKRLLGVSLGTLILWACTPHMKPIQLDEIKLSKVPAVCEQAGACVLQEKLQLEQTQSTSSIINILSSSPPPLSATIRLEQEVLIANPRGLEYAYVTFPKLYGRVNDVSIKVFDLSGNVTEYKNLELVATLRQTGKIPVPGVKTGYRYQCTLEGTWQGLLEWYEYDVQRSIPVLRSQISLGRTPDFNYNYRASGIPAAEQTTTAESSAFKIFSIQNYQFKNVNPPSLLPYQGWINDKAPRVRIMRETEESFGNWEKRLPTQPDTLDFSPTLMKAWKEEPMSVDEWQKPLFNLVQTIVPSTISQDSAAKFILQYVQNEFVCDSSFTPMIVVRTQHAFFSNHWTVNYQEIIRNKKGNQFELTSLYTSMLHALGINANMLLAGSYLDGGLSPDFPYVFGLNNYLVHVQLGKYNGLAAPSQKGYSLGNYPLDIKTGLGIYLMGSEKPSTKIQLPARKDSVFEYEVDIRIDSTGDKAMVRFIPQGLARDVQRHFYSISNLNIRETLIREWFDALPKEFSVKLKSVNGLGRLQDSFNVDAEIGTPSLAVKRDGRTLIRFGMLLDKVLGRLDSARDIPATMLNQFVLRERISVPKFGSHKELHWACDPMKNAMISMECSTEEKQDESVFSRTIRIGSDTHPVNRIQELLPSIEQINRMRSSSVEFTN